MGFFYLTVAFLMNATANVFLKIGADRGVHLDLSLGVGKLIALHSFLILGIFLFACNILFYIATLRTLPLSIAYPVMVGMSLLLANGIAVLFLHESIGWQQMLGYVLILTGITFVIGYGR